jgi:signal transduction histidine kinase
MNAISQFPQGRDDEDELQLRRESEKMQVIGRLAASVAHDFNNLLTGILLYCDLLSAGLEKNGRQNSESAERDADQFESAVAELVQQVEEVRMASEHGAALTRQLLAIARKQGPELRPVRINKIVLSTQNLLRRLIGEQIELAVVLDSALDGDGVVLADPAQVRQILLNLVLNARDAMQYGGTINLSTRAAEFPGAEVNEGKLHNAELQARAGSGKARRAAALAVKDSGCGMDARSCAHLFEPFFTTKNPGMGTGLGLATVQRIVEELRGVIEVESQPGQGTKIEIFLPIADIPDVEVPAGETSAPAQGA